LKPTQRIEFTTDEVTWMSLDVSPDGRTIVFELLGDLYVLPITGGKAQRITSGMALDTQPRFSPDGDRILFVSDRSGSENLWTLERGKTIDDTTEESAQTGLRAVTRGKDASYASPEWSPDGKYVVASKTDRFTWIDVNHTVWIYSLGGEEGVQLSANGGPIYGMGSAFGPDSRYLYMAHRDPEGDDYDAFAHRIDRYDLETGELWPLVGRVGGAVRPALSPDGRFMVYASRHDGQTGYRLRRLADGTEEWLSFPVQHDLQENNWMGTSSDHMPGYSFTPDGDAIITSIDGNLYRIDVLSGERTQIPFEADVSIDIAPLIHFDERVPDGPVGLRQIRWPSVSPDGSKLVFTAVHRLYVKDLASGRVDRIVELDDLQAAPTWSHDGRWIAFVSWSDLEGGHLYKVAPNGGSLERLSRVGAFYTDPVWVPGDEEILVAMGTWQQRGENMEWARIPATGGDAVAVAPASGSRPHFGKSRDRFYVYQRENGLVSMRLDGSDRRGHLRVMGMRAPLGPGGPRPAREILIGPDGEHALVYADLNVYRVAVPRGGEVQTISLVDPEDATFPVEKLSVLGGDFMNWGANGAEATWSLGNTLFRYRFADAAVDDAYQADEQTVDLEFPRFKGAGTVVLRGGRLLTMDPDASGDGIVENGAIVVVDNRIERVGPSSAIETPTGAREIDVSGTTILPGFVDLHAHLRPARGMHRNAAWDYLNYLAFGVTTTRNAAETIDNLTYSDLVEMGHFIGPRIFSCGPPILADNGIQSLADALQVVKRYRHYYGHNTIKMYLTGDRTVRQWMSIASRELRATPTTEGIDMKTMITQVIDGYSLEHLLPHFPLSKDVVQLVARSGTFYDPTLIVSTGPRPEYYWWTRTDVHDNAKVRRFTPHDFLDRETRRRPWFHEGEFYYQEHAEDLKKIVEAGGKVGVGSHGEMQGISYHWELWNIQSGGMKELDALRAATLYGAQAIGFEQDLGSITEGKMADLLVLERDPLEDIQNSTSLRYVMKNGLLYDADTLDMIWPIERELPRMYWQGTDPKISN
jgi:imidazolonepropionase-like amidohydrolase/Tol biopolymer transport system component